MTTAIAVPAGGSPERAKTRRRERRAGLGGLIASLLPALRRTEGTALRVAFEEAARRLVGADVVRVREGHAPAVPTRSDTPTTVVVEVPGEGSRRMVLEAGCAVPRRFDDWDVQVLATASHVAALVLEIERARGGRPARRRSRATAPRRSSDPARRCGRCANGSNAWRPPISRC